MQPRPAARHPWSFWFLIAVLVALVIVFTPVAFGHPTVNSGDPRAYAESMERMFDGNVPYIDFDFEHLPLAIVPMAAAQAVTETTGIPFAYPFMLLMLGALYLTGVLVVRIGDQIGVGDAGMRFVLIVAPMLLIAPFRIDALPVVLAVAAVSLAMQEREGASFGAAVGGVLAKGWPVVLAGADWWRGRRFRATALVAITAVVGAAMVALPGFRAGRDFVGVHEETLSGTLVIVWRLLTGHAAGIVDSAGSLYVTTGRWALGLDLVIGGAVIVLSLLVVRRAFTWQGGIALTGALTYGVLLASPLLSTQFVLWPIPFVALTGSTRSRWLLTAAAALSVMLTAVWSPFHLWWHTGWLIRNVVLVAAAASFVFDLRTSTAAYEASTSLKNLPV
jgi:hypothetical protein